MHSPSSSLALHPILTTFSPPIQYFRNIRSPEAMPTHVKTTRLKECALKSSTIIVDRGSVNRCLNYVGLVAVKENATEHAYKDSCNSPPTITAEPITTGVLTSKRPAAAFLVAVDELTPVPVGEVPAVPGFC